MTVLKTTLDKHCQLEKFPGKGGWTYIRVPEISPNKKNPFGWVTVSGHIDTVSLTQHKLLPFGDGSLFLPVKASIRKKINKEAGDTVQLSIYIDESKTVIPEEIIACFRQEPKHCYQNFINLPQGQQKAFIDWIYEAKTTATQTKRIVSMLERLDKNLGFYS
jgi:hypothetical protein